jgi:hypothetical protein
MMRWLLLASLMFSCNLLAARLQTNATADTYLYDQRSVASTAGSFAIRMASTDAMTRMSEANTTTNYATGTTGRLGYQVALQERWVMRWATLDDSMRAYQSSGKYLRWDSARVVVKITAALGASDNMAVEMYELRSARDFVETEATWNIYKTSNNWGTPGAGNTSSDIHSPFLDSSATLTSSSTDMSFKIPGTNISDTLNNVGVVLMIGRSNYDGATNTTVNATIGSDDNATEGNRPIITVYYTEMEYPDFGGADTLLLKATNDATTIGVPVMTFDISTVTATATLGACSVYVYVNASYSDNSEGTIGNSIGIAMKPINIGTGTGGATATGKLHWASWFENGNTDSTWGAIGATDIGAVCNRSSATGDDKTTDTSLSLNVLSGTGWRSVAIDTMAVRAYLNGTCSNFAVFMQPTASITDDAWYVLSSVEGANDPYLVINYTPGAATATVGTGRFGRSQTGEYLNVR